MRKNQNSQIEDIKQTTEQNMRHLIEFIPISGKPKKKKISDIKKQKAKSTESIQSTTDSNEVQKWNDIEWIDGKNVKTTDETNSTDNNIIENVIDVNLEEDFTIQPRIDEDLDIKTTGEPDSLIKHSSERTCQ
jgi:hypothetical protein